MLRRPRPSGRVGHVAALDGVRGLAVVAVVLYHLDPGAVPGGFLGVSLFFTLSGFLITNLLVAEWRSTGTIDLGAFWQRRFRRLLPASLAGIALVVVLSPAWTSSQLDDLPGDVLGALGYVANWRFIAEGDRYGAGFEAPSPLLHYWSLAIEEQFYLVVGALTVVLAAGRSLRRWVVVFGVMTIASVVAAVVLYDPLSVDRLYFGSLTRAAELLAGVLFALAIGMEIPDRFRRTLRIVGPVALAGVTAAVLTVEVGDTALYRGGLWAMAVASVLVIAGALVDGPMQRVLAWRPLTTIGLVSYGIYVYHWPVLVWLDEARTGLEPWLLHPVRLGVTAALTLASFVLLERPIREGRVTGRSVIGAGVMGSAVLAASAWLVSLDADQRAVAGEAPAIDLVAAAEPESEPEPEPVVVAEAAELVEATTTTTTVPVEPFATVVIMGDSLVHQAYPTIADRFDRHGVESILIGGPGETLMTEQAAWLSELDAAVMVHDPDVVILQSCCGTGDPRRPDPYVGPDGAELVPDTPEMWQEWERLASVYTDAARQRGAQVYWVLAPPAQTNGYYGPIEGRIGVANDIYAGVAACSDMVATIDWGLLSAPDGGYAEALPDALGESVVVRTEDGLHFTEAGQALLADLTRSVASRGWDGRASAATDQCSLLAPLAALLERG